MSHYNDCIAILDSLKLKGISLSLDDVAENTNNSHLEFLKELLSREIEYRTERRLKRNMTGAHFPVSKR